MELSRRALLLIVAMYVSGSVVNFPQTKLRQFRVIWLFVVLLLFLSDQLSSSSALGQRTGGQMTVVKTSKERKHQRLYG